MEELKREWYWNRINWLFQRMIKLMGLGCRLRMTYNALDENNEIPHDETALNKLKDSLEDAIKNLSTKKDTVEDLPLENDNQEKEIADFFALFKEYGISNEDELMDSLNYVYNCDIKEKENLTDLAIWCFILALSYHHCHAEFENKGTNNQDDEAITTLFMIADFITEKSYEAIGYWSRKSEVKISAARGQGAMSKELGEISIREAEKILDKIGGIVGYFSLGYGQKKPLTDEIAQKLKLKDKRHVYNLLKKIKAKMPND